MKKVKYLMLTALLTLSACNLEVDIEREEQALEEPAVVYSGPRETATFAGGCFWCMEPAFESKEGVLNVVVGYSGGNEASANYRDVSGGKTAHREVVQIEYNPGEVDYASLLATFFQQIDPTDDGGQFADRGFHYTTAIYFHDEDQKSMAEKAIDELNSSGRFEAPVATVIEPYKNFFLAEEYHQDFYIKSSAHYERYAKGSGRKDFN